MIVKKSMMVKKRVTLMNFEHCISAITPCFYLAAVVLYILLHVFGQKSKCAVTLKAKISHSFKNIARFLFWGFLTSKSSVFGMKYLCFFCQWFLTSVEIYRDLSRPWCEILLCKKHLLKTTRIATTSYCAFLVILSDCLF